MKTMHNSSNSTELKGPLVSVIIPNYNHASYIADAIHSVLAQEYPHVEVIVVDDGSTDNSCEVIGSFGQRVRAIWQKNQGLSAARNTGIQIAQGEYIALLDADDMYEPDFLSTLVPLLQANPHVGACHCGYQFVDHRNRPLAQREARSIPAEEFYTTLLGGNFLVPEAILVRRSCYEDVGPFDTSLRASEDWDLWLRIARDFKIMGTTRILTRHRILPGSMSSDPTRMLTNRLIVLGKHVGALDEDSPSTWTLIQRCTYGKVYLKAVVEYLQVENVQQAHLYFKKMAEIAPDLLTRQETLYEIGCGRQPKGSRGDFSSLDIEQNSRTLLGLLDSLFSQRTLSPRLKSERRRIYARAYLVLGLLSYGADHFAQARRFLLRAVTADPLSSLDTQLVTTLLKSLLGSRFVNSLRRRKLASALEA
jgi:glycosyltransferase involved in cell wall biosynthesis